MRPMRASLQALLVGFTLAGCGDREGLSDADVAAIRRVGEDFVQATLAADFDRIVAQRTDSVVWMPPGSPVLKGKDAVRRFLETGPRATGFVVNPLYIEGRDDLAYVRGSYVSSTLAGADTVSETGKYVAVLFRQRDGSWLVGLEAWNTDAPSAPVAPATAPGPARALP